MATGYEKYDALIVDPELDTRMRLKQATTAVHNFGKVYQVSSLREALQKCHGESLVDVIFINYRFDRGDVDDFIIKGKESPQGQDAAYVLVMQAKDQESSKIADTMLKGFDGLLFEPYSVDVLVEITKIAAKVKGDRRVQRETAAIKFLLKDVINQLDQISFNLAQGKEVGPSFKKFKDAAVVLRSFEGEKLKKYFDLAVDTFMDAPTPKKVFSRVKYGGASSRVKARMEKKKAELMAQLGGAGAEEPPKQ